MVTVKAVLLTGANQMRRDGTASVKLRVTVGGKSAYISTGLHSTIEGWDAIRCEATKKHPNASIVNTRLATLKGSCLKILLNLDGVDSMTPSNIKDYLAERLGAVVSGRTKKNIILFSDFIDQLVLELNDKKSTSEWHLRAVIALRDAIGRKDIAFADITTSTLKSVEAKWRAGGLRKDDDGNRVPMDDGGIGYYMRALRSAWFKADERLNDDNGCGPVQGNPWKRYSIPKTDDRKSKEKAISAKEIRKLYSLDLPRGSQMERTRDTILLSFCMAGMSTVDLYNMDSLNSEAYTYQRTKLTKKRDIEVSMEPEVLALIEKLKGKDSLLNLKEHYTSGHRSMTRALGKCCKVLAKMAGIDSGFSPQWMRHSWASIARNECGVSPDDVAFALGHKLQDKKVTDIYLKDDHSLRHRINRKVLDYVFGEH